ncbi:MAG: hypothetical protein R3B70_47975 [Polyangiaceae bacterium]
MIEAFVKTAKIRPLSDWDYATLEEAAFAHFPASQLPLREAALRSPERWGRFLEDPAIRGLIWLLYTGVASDESWQCQPEVLTGDTPLTPLFFEALSSTEPEKALRAVARRAWESEGGQRGAGGFLIAALGEDLGPDPDKGSLRQVGRQMSARVLYKVNRIQERLGPSLAPASGGFRAFNFLREPGFSSLLCSAIPDVVKAWPDITASQVSHVTAVEGLARIDAALALQSTVGLDPWYTARPWGGLLRFARAMVASNPLAAEPAPEPVPDTSTGADVGGLEGPPIPHRPRVTLSLKLVTRLVRDLASFDDDVRAEAQQSLASPRRLADFSPKALSYLVDRERSCSESDDPAAPYVAGSIRDALAAIAYQEGDVEQLADWAAAMDLADEARSGIGSSLLQLVRRISPEGLRALCRVALAAGPAAKRALLWSFGGMLGDVAVPDLPSDSRENPNSPAEDVLSILEECLLTMLARASHAERTSVLSACQQHPAPTAAFIDRILVVARAETDIELRAPFAVVLATLCGRFRRFLELARQAAAGPDESFRRLVVSPAALPATWHFEVASEAGASPESLLVLRRSLSHAPQAERVELVERWAAGGEDAFPETLTGAMVTIEQAIRDFLQELARHPMEALACAGLSGLLRLEIESSLRAAAPGSSPGSANESLADTLSMWPIPSHDIFRALLDVASAAPRWTSSNEIAALAAARVAHRHIGVLRLATGALSQAEGWQARRPLLAIVAEVARQAPALVNQEVGEQLLPHLLASCRDPGDQLTRMYALRTLGHLRNLSAEVGAILLERCRDTVAVFGSAQNAARTMQRFDPATVDVLLPELTGTSAATAGTVAALLGTLGTGRQAVEDPVLHARIAQALAAACVHPASYRLDPGGIYPNARYLADTCYQALLEVTSS